MAWGILYCKSKPEEKVKVLYEILQDQGQPRIAASDKDLYKTLSLLINLATNVVNKYEASIS